MPESINSKLKEQYDHDDSGGSLDTNLGDFLDSEGASGTSNNSKWRDWASGTGTSLNTRLFHKHGGSGSFMTRWKNWIAFSSTHSFNFDGSNDYLDCGNSTGIQFSGSFSVSFWFNTTDATATNEILVSKANDGVNDGWLIRLNSSRKLEFVVLSGVITDSGSASNDGNWHHVLAVHESGVGNRLYKNGSLVASNSTGTDLSNHVPNLHIGNQDYSTSRAINSLIDEVAVWNTALSASDVTSIYNNGKVIDLSKSASYGTDRTGNLKLWLRCGDKAEPESTTAIARQDFYCDFDGTDDSVIVNQTFTTDNFALSFWINPDDVTGDKYLFDQNAGICRSVVIGYQNGYINFVNDDNVAGNYYPTGTATDTQIPVSVGEWQHYVMMTDGTKVYGYRNGVEVVNITGKWGASGAEKLWIGQWESGNNYNGKITAVGIWNKTLSSTEISAIYNAGRHTNLLDSYNDNLLLFLAFGALDAVTGLPDTDSTIYDRSGNSNHGTTSGTATGDLKSPPNAQPEGYAKQDVNRSTTTP